MGFFGYLIRRVLAAIGPLIDKIGRRKSLSGERAESLACREWSGTEF
jgi:hypothetical protein